MHIFFWYKKDILLIECASKKFQKNKQLLLLWTEVKMFFFLSQTYKRNYFSLELLGFIEWSICWHLLERLLIKLCSINNESSFSICYFSVITLTYFHLTKGCAKFFYARQFLRVSCILIVFICKVFINTFSKRQFVMLIFQFFTFRNITKIMKDKENKGCLF